jgi:hypothetical protein
MTTAAVVRLGKAHSLRRIGQFIRLWRRPCNGDRKLGFPCAPEGEAGPAQRPPAGRYRTQAEASSSRTLEAVLLAPVIDSGPSRITGKPESRSRFLKEKKSSP